MEQALGLLETKGLIGAIEAADAMAKAADIKIVCKEKITAALVTIKIVGDTAAVRSALDAGAKAAEKVGQLVAVHLIPRPDDQIDFIIENSERIAVPQNSSDKKKITEEQLSVDNTEVKEKEEFALEEIQNKPPKQQKPKENDDAGFFGSLFNDEEIQDDVVLDQIVSEEIVEESEDIIPDILLTEEVEEDLYEENPEITEEISVNEETTTPEPEKTDTAETTESELKIIIEDRAEKVVEKPVEMTIAELDTETHEDIHHNEDDDIPEITELPEFRELELMSVPELRKLARGVKNFPIKGREISKANKLQLLGLFREIY